MRKFCPPERLNFHFPKARRQDIFIRFSPRNSNCPAFEKLSHPQRAILRPAAVATQMKAIAQHPSDVDAAKAWCADGGSIVLASAEQVAASEKATRPILDTIAQDFLNIKLRAAIHELKKNTQPSPAVEPCNGAVAQATPQPTSEEEWSMDLLLEGVWRVELSVDDFVRMGVMQAKLKSGRAHILGYFKMVITRIYGKKVRENQASALERMQRLMICPPDVSNE